MTDVKNYQSQRNFNNFKQIATISLATATLIQLPAWLWFPDQYVLFHKIKLYVAFQAAPDNIVGNILNGTVGTFTYMNPNFYNLVALSAIFTGYGWYKTKQKRKVREQGDILSGIVKEMDTEKFIELIQEYSKNEASKLEERVRMKEQKAMLRTLERNKDITPVQRYFQKRKIRNHKVRLSSFYEARIYLSEKEIPFYIDLETKNLIFLGAAGSGKTNAIWEYISKFIKWQVENNKFYTWIFYDRKHDFWTKGLYRPDKDFLFYPKDKRTIKWNYFDEFLSYRLFPLHEGKKVLNADATPVILRPATIREALEIYNKGLEEGQDYIIDKILNKGNFRNLLYAFAPVDDDPKSEKWNKRGRSVFEATMITVAYEELFPSPKNFIDFCNQFGTMDSIRDRVVELGIAKATRSVDLDAVLAESEAGTNVYQNFDEIASELKKTDFYYSAEECDFTTRIFENGWRKSPYFDKRLFLIQDPENETEYSRVFRAVLELLSKKIINLPNNLNRRITFVLDEAASLGNMPTIFKDLPREARSKGANLVLGVQTLNSFLEKFGEHGADEILANIKTRILLNFQDGENLAFVQKVFDKVKIRREKVSYNEKGEANYTIEEVEEPVLKPVDLTSLGPSQAWVKIENYVTKVIFDIPDIEDVDGLIENEDMIQTLPMDFHDKDMKIKEARHKKVIRAINYLKTHTNKPLTIANINATFKEVFRESTMSVSLLEKFYNEFIEHKEQVDQIIEQLKDNASIQNISTDEGINLFYEAYEAKTGLHRFEIEPFVDHLVKRMKQRMNGGEVIIEIKEEAKKEEFVPDIENDISEEQLKIQRATRMNRAEEDDFLTEGLDFNF